MEISENKRGCEVDKYMKIESKQSESEQKLLGPRVRTEDQPVDAHVPPGSSE